jgi:NADH pyrophosphatase NudC (nudix superfamily)
VFEESGIRVTNVRYVASQPWPFPHSLMMGFTADYESGEIRVQDDELVAAGFFEADRLPRLPPRHHSAAAHRAVPRRGALRENGGAWFAPLTSLHSGGLRGVWAALSRAQSGIISAILCWI